MARPKHVIPARVLHDYLLAVNLHPRRPDAALVGDKAVPLRWDPSSSPCEACETITADIIAAYEREKQ